MAVEPKTNTALKIIFLNMMIYFLLFKYKTNAFI
jgi:hypothetical protein